MPETRQAIVVCPEGADLSRKLLGLTLGERVLLSLQYSGFGRVAFVGDGPKPVSERATIEIVDVATIEGDAFCLASDLVFDRKFYAATKEAPDDVLAPVAWMTAAELGDGSGWLAKRDAARTEGEGFAQRVRDNNEASVAKRALLRSLRKPIDGFISRHLNRYVSLAVTRQLVKLGLRPNVFTVIFLFIGLAAAGFASQVESVWALVLSGVLFQAQSILDGCDGEMARLTFRYSKVGEWLDTVGDDITNYAYCFGLAFGLSRLYAEPWILWVGFGVLALQVIASGIMYFRMIQWGTGDLLAIPKADGGTESDNIVLRFFYTIGKRDFFVFAISLITAAQFPFVSFVVFAVGTAVVFITVVINDRAIAKMTPPARKG